MAGFDNSVRGNGLARVQRALAELEGDPQLLDRARVRFEESPPPYASDQSGSTTRSASPDGLTEEQRRRQERQVELGLEHQASEPYTQFEHQTIDEGKRILEADRNRTHRLRVGDNHSEIAYENVKKRWVEQGIWNSRWNKFALGRWKHEEPLELESESETDSEAGFSSFPSSLKQTQRKATRPKSDEEKRQSAERRVVREHEREASRPYYQFIYQISKERGRIQDESPNGEGFGIGLHDINTTAYENVKDIWTKRGIWNKRWGILPGMSWKHEEPFEEVMADDVAPQASLAENGSHEAGEAPIIVTNGAPFRSISGHPTRNPSESSFPSPVKSNDRHASQQGSSTYGYIARVESGDAEPSSSVPASPQFRTGTQVPRPTLAQASKKKRSHNDSQSQPVVSASLGPVHFPKASSPTGRKRPGPQRRPKVFQEVAPAGAPFSHGSGIAEPIPQTASIHPRRSKRLKPPRPSTGVDSTEITSTYSLNGLAQSRPKRKGAGNPKSTGSAKPQGVFKNRHSTRTRQKARKTDG